MHMIYLIYLLISHHVAVAVASGGRSKANEYLPKSLGVWEGSLWAHLRDRSKATQDEKWEPPSKVDLDVAIFITPAHQKVTALNLCPVKAMDQELRASGALRTLGAPPLGSEGPSDGDVGEGRRSGLRRELPRELAGDESLQQLARARGPAAGGHRLRDLRLLRKVDEGDV